MLADAIVRAYFGAFSPPRSIEIGLSYRGDELLATGYQRQSVPKGEWAVEGARASATVTFGPFRRAVAVDSADLYIEGERVQSMPFLGDVQLLPGMNFEHEAVVVVG